MTKNTKSKKPDSLTDIKSLPVSLATPYIQELAKHTMLYDRKLAKLLKQMNDAYQNFRADSDSAVNTATEIYNAIELNCLTSRAIMQDLWRSMQMRGSWQGCLIPDPDISDGISISFDEKSQHLHIEMPPILPVDGTMAAFLPGKIRCAMEKFSREYQETHNGKILRLSPAFVAITHHYNRKKKNASISMTDYDNTEFSAVLNALHFTRIFNDDPASIVLMQSAAFGRRDYTEVNIVPVSRKNELLQSIDFSLYRRKTTVEKTQEKHRQETSKNVDL